MRKSTSQSRRPLTSSLAKLPSAAAICAVLALASAASAADYYWDGDGDATGNNTADGSNLGGSGTWTPTGGTNWFNGTSNTAWPNLTPNGDRAIFTGLGAEVTLGGSVFVNALQFDSNGFSITNGGTASNILTLSGTTPTVQVTASGHTAVISALVAGNQGLTKTGAGTLVLGGGSLDTLANTFSGPVTLSAGTLRLDKAAGTLATASTDIQLNAGTLFFGSATNLLASNQLAASANVTVAGGALNFHAGSDISAASQTLNSLTMTAGTIGTTTGTFTNVADLNTINITNAFNLSGGTATINSGTIFNAGTFTISGGTLLIGGNTALRNTVFAPGAVNLNGGTVTMNYGTAAGALRAEFRLSSDVNVGGTSGTTIGRGGSGTATNEPAIILGDAARVFNVADSNAAGSDLTIGVKVDGGGIIKRGAGTMQLNTTANPFTGDILIEAGTLAFVGVAGSNDQTALGTGPKTITLANNATLALVGSNDADPNAAGGKGFVIASTGGTLDVASGRTFFLNDGVSNGAVQNQLQGTGTLTKTGLGILNVGRDFSSTFTGDVVVNQGRLDLTTANAVGNVGTITVDGTSGAARLNYTNTTAFTTSNNLVLQNGGVLSITGQSHNVPNTKTVTVGAGVSRIRVDDGGTATATATNRTFVLNGALNGGAGNTLEVAGPTAAARGVLALSNAAGDFAGTIVIDRNVSVENFARWNGTTATNTGKTIGTALIKFQNVVGGATSTGSATTLEGQLDLRDSGTGNNQVFNYGNNVDMTSTGGTIAVGNNTQQAVASTGGRFVLGTLALGAGNTLTVNTANRYSLEFAGATTLGGAATFAGSSDLTLKGGISGGTDLTKSGAGRLTIGAPAGPTYSGSTNITGGGVVFETLSAVGGSGNNITVGSGAYIGGNFEITQSNLINRLVANTNTSVIALGVSSAENLDLTTLPNARLGSVGNVTYTGTLTQAGTTTLLGGGGGTLILPGDNVISGTRTLDVGTSGTPAGVVALDGSNNFTGAINLSGGQLLRPASNSSLGDVANTITSTGGGIQLKAGAGFNIFGSRTITFGAGGFILDTNGNDLTVAGAIGNAGAGGFTKTGAGKLTLGAASTYLGKTLISGGTLSIAADNMLGAAPAAATGDQLQIQSGGTLEATASFTIPANRGVQFANGGGTISVTGSNTLTVASNTSGTAPLIKEGTGTLLITADPNNNNTNNLGGFFVNAGVLALQHSGSTDAPFYVANGATLRVLTGGALGDAYSVTVNEGGTFDLRGNDQISQLFGSGLVTNNHTAGTTLTVNSGTNATFDGVIQNGTSAIGFSKAGANTVTLTGANTYTGATNISQGVLAIQGAAGALGNTAITVGDNNGGDEVLLIGQAGDVWTGGALNRLGDTASITLNGRVRVTYTGPAAGSSGFTESMAAINVGSGANVFTLVPGTGAEVQLNTSALTRSNGGTVLLRGDNLGGTGVGSTRIVPTTAALVGAGGAAGSTSLSILPGAVGDTSSTGAGSGFLTVGANGLRLLGAGEYADTIAGAVPLRNISLAGGETVTASQVVNSLRVTGGVTTLAAGTTVTDNSGAVLFTGAGEIAGPGTIAFGPNEGSIMISQNDTAITGTINANITGANGLSIGSYGFDSLGNYVNNVIALGGTNSFVGSLWLNQGTLRLENANAINSLALNTAIMRAGSTLQLGGNSIVVRDLQSSVNTAIQNASANAATLTTVNAAGTTHQGTITDGVGGGALSFVKRGLGSFTLNNGTNNYSGTTTIERGVFLLANSARLTSNGTDGSTAVSVSGGATLRLTNNTGGNSTDRLRNNAAITLNSATLDFDNPATGSTNYAETTGALTLAGGANTITTDQAATNQTTTLTFASLARTTGSQATVNFTGGGLGADTRNRLVFTAAPTLNDGLIGGWAFANGNEFATYNAAGTISVATAATTTDAETAWDTTKNVKPAANVVLTDNRTVNSLNFASGRSMDLGTKTLNIDSGGLIHQTTVATDTISNGTLTAGSTAGSDLVIRTSGAGTLTVSAVIADNATGAVGLIKSGPGKLVLSGTNTYSGPTSINGVLSISSDVALGAVPATPTPGNIRIVDGGTLEIANTMTLNENRGIELGGSFPTIDVKSGTLSYNGAITITGGTASTDLTLLGNIAFGGNVNSIGGGLNVGTNMAGTAPVGVANVSFAPTSGSLTIGANAPVTADLNIGYRAVASTPDSGSTVGVLDLTGLQDFTASLANLRIGSAINGGTATAKGDLLLPAISNITVASGVLIGDSTAVGNNTVQSTVQFGSGVSSLTTSSTVVGGRKGNGLLSVAEGGRLTLNGFTGNSADLLVGYNNIDATGVSSLGAVDVSKGILIADLDELVVGYKLGAGGSSGGATGTVTLGDREHSISANQVRLGDYSGTSTGAVSGTLNIDGGTLAVNNDVSLGLYAGNGTAGTSAGTLNITGGSVVVDGNIVSTASDKATATLNLNGGTLDMTGGSINVDTFNAQTGILQDVGQIFNGDGVTPAALTKTGVGLLELKGANMFTGGANIDEGSLYVSGSLVTGAVNAASGTTFGGEALLNGSLSLGNGSTLKLDLSGLTGYDQITMASQTGSVALGENVNLSLSLGFTPDTSVDTFYYILNRADSGTFTNTFAGLAEGTIIDLGNGVTGKLTYLANWTGSAATSSITGGNDVAITIPEPGTVVSLFGGIGALLGMGRFRRRAFRA